MIKILIGGSPCTFWSVAQKKNREIEASGMGWELFKNYLIAKEKFKPDFFLYENNKSAAQPIKDQISRELGVDLMYINSALVSAQNRQRFYAFNWDAEQPEDRGILLDDILETGIGVGTNAAGKSRCLMANYGTSGLVYRDIHDRKRSAVAESVGIGYRNRREADGKLYRRFETSGVPKANALTTVQTDSMVAKPAPAQGISWRGRNNGSCFEVRKDQKANALTATGHQSAKVCYDNDGKIYPAYTVENGMVEIAGKKYPIRLPDGDYVFRKYTPVEAERLQTLPDGYTSGVADSHRYKALGNGWTAEIIIHILSYALDTIPRDEELVVLSMYDGIATGRYCLDKMGFKNVTYYAYEIDPKPIEIARKNWPDIIHLGDAFAVRSPEWSLPAKEAVIV